MTEDSLRRLRAIVPVAALCLLVAIVAYAGRLGPPALDRTVEFDLVILIAVVGYGIFASNSGILSFGHAAFMAVGAYTAGVLTIPASIKEFQYQLPWGLEHAEVSRLTAVIAAGLAATIVAAFIAVPLMRLSGLSAGLATLAVLVVVRVVAQNWTNVTGGTAGMTGVPGGVPITWLVVWAFGAIAASYAFSRSRFGLRLRASRDDEIAARGVGIRVRRERGIAWVISAFFAGVGGALYAQTHGTFGPDDFYLSITFLLIVMLVVGGVHTVSGAVIGAIVISTVGELLHRFEEGVNISGVSLGGHAGIREVGLALFLILVLWLRPRGLTGGSELDLPFLRRLQRFRAHTRSKGNV